MNVSVLVVGLWIAWFWAATTFVTRPTPLAQLAMMVTGLVLVVVTLYSFVAGFVRIRSSGLKGLLVPLISVLLIGAGPLCGFWLRSLIFDRQLSRWQAVAEWAERQTLESPSHLNVLNPPPEFSDLVYAVHAKRTEACGFVAWFFWGRGFPVKHTVRIYSPQDASELSGCFGEWWRVRQLRAHWYEASD